MKQGDIRSAGGVTFECVAEDTVVAHVAVGRDPAVIKLERDALVIKLSTGDLKAATWEDAALKLREHFHAGNDGSGALRDAFDILPMPPQR